uniref:Uncharacterized protein n=2 Tax=viral metagenome TaxID=1070528 RepID=A0A6H1ZY95_9ZZZZ
MIENLLRIYNQDTDNVLYSGNVSERKYVYSPINLIALYVVDRWLTRLGFRPAFKSQPKQGGKMEPITFSWIALAHTDLKYDLHEIGDDFIPLWKKVDLRGTYSQYEYGYIGKNWTPPIRFVLSPEFKPIERSGFVGTRMLSGMYSNHAPEPYDVYPVVLFGADETKVFRYECAVTAL